MYPIRTRLAVPPLSSVKKSLQIREADARTRTADPFITSDGDDALKALLLGH